MAAYEEAGRIFKTDEVLAGWNQAKAASDKVHSDSAAAEKKATQEKAKLAEFQQLMSEGQSALAAKNFSVAIGKFGAARKLNPDNVDAKAQQAKDRAAAETNQKTVVQPPVVTPNTDAQKKKTQYDSLVANGKKALEEKHYADAVKTLSEATSLLPGEKSGQDLLKTAQQQIQQQQKNAQTANEVAANQGKFKQHIEDARKLIQAKKLDDAAKALDAAASLSPKDSLLGQVRQELDQARRLQTAEIEAGKKKVAFDQAIKQGKDALNAKQFDAAIAAFKSAGQIEPNDQTAKALLLQAENSRNALLAAQKKQAEAPKGPPPPTPQQKAEYDRQMQLGLSLDKQKKWDDAMKAYDAALKQIPKDGKAQESFNKATYNRHMADGNRYLTARRFPDAVREFDAALKLYPKDTDAAAGLKKAKDAK
jgi:hypothetical protein